MRQRLAPPVFADEQQSRAARLLNIISLGAPVGLALYAVIILVVASDQMRNSTFIVFGMLIPYFHHEKWDGTGYPRGLKEAQIPLAARLFRVVAVWDALRSERPYSAGGTRVREHIRTESGNHFDPNVVALFLRMIGEGS